MKGPLENERPALPGGSSVNKRQLKRAYQLLTLVQGPFEKVFWAIEQRKAGIQDQISHLESER